MNATAARDVSTALESKVDRLARQRFADILQRVIAEAGGATNFIGRLMEKAEEVAGDMAVAKSSTPAMAATPAEALERCAAILRRDPETQRSLMRLFNQTAADCTALSPSAPAIQLEAERVVWLQFRQVLESNPAVNLGVRRFVDSVRDGQCILFPRDANENTIVESLFPDYKYLFVSKGAAETATRLPDLFDLRLKTSERINEFHKTAGSDDCKVVEVDGPKVEVRKELRDLEARKLHIVTKELIDELYEFYRQEMLSGVRATTGIAHVPNYG